MIQGTNNNQRGLELPISYYVAITLVAIAVGYGFAKLLGV